MSCNMSKDLQRPFQCGFTREIVKSYQANEKLRVCVYYRSPEGNRLRSLSKISQYLKENDLNTLSEKDFTVSQHAIAEPEYQQFEKEILIGSTQFSSESGGMKKGKRCSRQDSPQMESLPSDIQRRRRKCGSCRSCRIKEDCGKCENCVKKKTRKQKCMERKCEQMVDVTEHCSQVVKTNEDQVVPSRVTIQLSNEFIDACYNLHYGERHEFPDATFKSLVINKDNKKTTVEIEDNNEVIHIKCQRKARYSLIEIGCVSEEWTSVDVKPTDLESLEKQANVEKLNTVDKVIDTSCVGNQDSDTECEDSYSNVCDTAASSGDDDNYTTEKSLSIKRELHSEDEVDQQNSGVHNDHIDSNHSSDSDEGVVDEVGVYESGRPMRTASRRVQYDSDTETSADAEDQSDYETQLPAKKSKKKCSEVTHSKKINSQSEKEKSWGGPEKRKKINTFIIKVQCPECELWLKYSRLGIMRHVKLNHPGEQEQLTQQLDQDTAFYTMLTDEQTQECDICGKDVPQSYLPLHVQWKHAEHKYDQCQTLLEKYYDLTNNPEKRLAPKTMKYGFLLKFKKVSIQGILCTKCERYIASRKMTNHPNKCKVNKNKKYYFCDCGFKTLHKKRLDDHKEMCSNEDTTLQYSNAMNLYLLKTQCPVCSSWHKYHRCGIIRHLKENEKWGHHEDLVGQFKEEVLDHNLTLGDTDKLTCQICQSNVNKHLLMLHVAVNHTEHKYEESQLVLEKIYSEKLAAKESLESKTPKYGFNLRLEKRLNSVQTMTCKFCNTRLTASKTKMKTHLEKCKFNPNKRHFYHCKCGFKSVEEPIVTEHKKTCNIVPEIIVCEYCGIERKSLPDYYSHRKYAHGIMTNRTTPIQEYPCDNCGKVFYTKYKLKRHNYVKHSDLKNCVCEICAHGFKFPSGLKRHIEFAHHNIYRYHCDKCGHGINKREQLKTHVCGKTRKRKKLHEVTLTPSKKPSHEQPNTISRSSRKQKQGRSREDKRVVEEPLETESYHQQYIPSTAESAHNTQNKYRKLEPTSLPTSSFTQRNNSDVYESPTNMSDQGCMSYPVSSYPTHLLGGAPTHANGSHQRLLHQRNLMEMGFSNNMHDSYLAMQNHAFVNMLSQPHQQGSGSVMPAPDDTQTVPASFSNVPSRNINPFH